MQQRWRWIPTLTLFPLLYLIGWLFIQPIRLVFDIESYELVSLLGTLVSLFLFLVILPSWIRFRWNKCNSIQAIGLSGQGREKALIFAFKGLAWALLLIGIVLTFVFVGSWGRWLGPISFDSLLYGLALGLAVGVAEEVIFRGWLWSELNQLLGPRWGILAQASIFSLVHLRFDIGFIPLLGLLLGLFLFGLVLSVRRRLDEGSLWGCIGIHGGLVGIWFLLNTELIQLSPEAPEWLVGVGGLTPNPIGSVVGISVLMAMLWRQITALEIARRPLRGARSASSKGATP